MSGPALEGDLGRFLPSEVLQLIQLSQSTGRLEFTRGDERVDLHFERGRPVFARTSGVAVRAGEVLVHRGVVTRAALEDALEQQRRQPGTRVGARLIASGLASSEQVRDAVLEVLRRIVYGLLMWREGRFRFWPGEPGIVEDIQLDLDLDRLILEGLRLADERRESKPG